MPDRAQILLLIFAAVDEVNNRLPAHQRLEKSEASVIAGDRSTLESLEFVNLILGCEGRLGEALGVPVPLAERLVGDEGAGPPETLGALADLAVRVLKGADRDG